MQEERQHAQIVSLVSPSKSSSDTAMESSGARFFACTESPLQLCEFLLRAGFDPAQPTAWHAEGLFARMSELQAHALLAAVASLSAPKSAIFFGEGGGLSSLLSQHGFTGVDAFSATLPPLPEGVSIRNAAAADEAAACMQLAVAEGWATGLSVWQPAIVFDRSGCFVAERADAAIVGTTFTYRYCGNAAWVLLVFVDRSLRRKGVALKLLVRAIAYLRQTCGVLTIGLDATAAGRAVYERLGFRQSGLVRVFDLDPSMVAAASVGEEVQQLKGNDELIGQAIALDAAAFGFRREGMRSLIAQGVFCVALGVVDCGRLRGFALARKTVDGNIRAGPLVAESQEVARGLLVALSRIAIEEKKHCRVWVLEQHCASQILCQDLGFVPIPEATVTRMWLTASTEDPLPSPGAEYWCTSAPDMG